MLKRLLAAPVLAFSVALALPLVAAPQARASGDVDVAKVVQAAVLPGWRMADGRRMVALRLNLAQGWHTYWRSPGDVGIPPSFDWSGSSNLKAVKILWPVPKIFDTGGMRSIGYDGTVVLPVALTPVDPAKPIVVDAKVAIGVCDDICLPATLGLSADLTGAGAKDPQIAAALARQPETPKQAGLTGAICNVAPISGGMQLTAALKMPSLGPKAVTVVELPNPEVWVSQAKTRQDNGMLTASVEIMPPSQPFTLDRSKLVITVLGEGRAVELDGCPG